MFIYLYSSILICSNRSMYFYISIPIYLCISIFLRVYMFMYLFATYLHGFVSTSLSPFMGVVDGDVGAFRAPASWAAPLHGHCLPSHHFCEACPPTPLSHWMVVILGLGQAVIMRKLAKVQKVTLTSQLLCLNLLGVRKSGSMGNLGATEQLEMVIMGVRTSH